MIEFKDLTVDECKAFSVSQMYKFLKEWVDERRESAIENVQMLDNPTLMACITGELTAMTYLKKLLKAIDDKANGRLETPKEAKSNLDKYASEKPEELTNPIKLRD